MFFRIILPVRFEQFKIHGLKNWNLSIFFYFHLINNAVIFFFKCILNFWLFDKGLLWSIVIKMLQSWSHSVYREPKKYDWTYFRRLFLYKYGIYKVMTKIIPKLRICSLNRIIGAVRQRWKEGIIKIWKPSKISKNIKNWKQSKTQKYGGIFE